MPVNSVSNNALAAAFRQMIAHAGAVSALEAMGVHPNERSIGRMEVYLADQSTRMRCARDVENELAERAPRQGRDTYADANRRRIAVALLINYVPR